MLIFPSITHCIMCNTFYCPSKPDHMLRTHTLPPSHQMQIVHVSESQVLLSIACRPLRFAN